MSRDENIFHCRKQNQQIYYYDQFLLQLWL